jgi:hypothetical protein
MLRQDIGKIECMKEGRYLTGFSIVCKSSVFGIIFDGSHFVSEDKGREENMGEHLVGLLLYTFITMAPFGIWAFIVLKKEKWVFSKEKHSFVMGLIVAFGLLYQILMPFYWSFITSPKGL